jgi:hypothetical protein
MESWLRAEVVNNITVAETLISGRTILRYDIGNAPVKELRLKVPAAFRNVEITGANIRSRSQTGEVWRVELQSRTRGVYLLNVSWEQPRSAATNIDLTGVSAEGVERETGLLAVIAKKPLQVSEARAADLQRVDTDDYPDWAGRPDDTTVMIYRYVRPGYQLAVRAQRYNEAEVLQALVDNARFTTVVADDGQMMTEMSLSVRNNGRQFLEIELPQNSKIWSAFVAGQPVRPSLRDGKLLLPIQQSGGEDSAVAVDLTFVGASPFPRNRGEVHFDSPKFDVPLKNAHWELFLPPDYDYANFKGTMSRETAPTAETASSSFSQLEYTRMEKASQESFKAEVKRDVSEAQRQLAGGNVREATANFNRAKAKFYAGKDENSDVKKLEKELQVAQGSNLINAQNDFVYKNNWAQPGMEGKVPAQNAPASVQYATADAEQQWAKLQQAQEMVAAKVQPLRVNLPVRGLRHVFNQVLQTEVGKSMSIQLFAASTKAVSWPKRIGTAAGAFLILWGLVIAVSRATRRSPSRSN